MSFRKICEEEEKENQARVKSIQNACGAMRVMLQAINGDRVPSSSREHHTDDDSLMEDNYEEEKKIDEQFLRHQEILNKYEERIAHATEAFDIARLNFSKIISIVLKVKPSLTSFHELRSSDMPAEVHSRMDKAGLHAFCAKGGDRRFPHIVRKLKVVMDCANRTLFDAESLNLGLSFNEKLQILKLYYKDDKYGGTQKSPLRITGHSLLQIVNDFLTQHRVGYKKCRQMRKLLSGVQ